MVRDLISDMLTRLRNASMVFHNFTVVKYSKIILKILYILKKEGYIKDYKINFNKNIIVLLRYHGWWVKSPFFSKLIRISKPGRKVYSSYKDFNKKIKNINFEQGIIVISTSSGLMTNFKAKELKRGGEILFYIS